MRLGGDGYPVKDPCFVEVIYRLFSFQNVQRPRAVNFYLSRYWSDFCHLFISANLNTFRFSGREGYFEQSTVAGDIGNGNKAIPFFSVLLYK